MPGGEQACEEPANDVNNAVEPGVESVEETEAVQPGVETNQAGSPASLDESASRQDDVQGALSAAMLLAVARRRGWSMARVPGELPQLQEQWSQRESAGISRERVFAWRSRTGDQTPGPNQTND